MVRKETGGYCPTDPLEFAFISTVILYRDEHMVRDNTKNRLQNVINRNK
ncbi:hypothetical protein LCGC14_1229840 [marine sediment metagenome]|uniref:Uncharacterized protein n=1 Tax=marine sediment metagenome TaxID=412755 RepID=A0A0F9LD09_9ZZZZ